MNPEIASFAILDSGANMDDVVAEDLVECHCAQWKHTRGDNIGLLLHWVGGQTLKSWAGLGQGGASFRPSMTRRTR
eukprot:CAMPEP_0183460816 /NCGR_PEP_ID=MMETSP0370-20130417/138387_1 /TAXON_ID=268820 /ORGANISM="Peridinium aciculiferum, Strain PAER-2" /LENGTH=75 /DNA_ID=CAMNT_0025652737 /DNA_START=27 /DNA_END=250 /DNA_ORIENTATION=+